MGLLNTPRDSDVLSSAIFADCVMDNRPNNLGRGLSPLNIAHVLIIQDRSAYVGVENLE